MRLEREKKPVAGIWLKFKTSSQLIKLELPMGIVLSFLKVSQASKRLKIN